MVKKIPIHLNESDEKQSNDFIYLIGLDKTYGAFPKAVKFGITLGSAYLKSLEEVIPDLESDELDVLLSSIKRMKLRKYELQKIDQAQETLKKV